ncbi:hypothetical protein REJC140_00180 [Pseudorhizobium endolithicum]|uniref:Uncharacterized protein n=1 Tax=Pseudorhizobium endolithicum TaxID=1191678 RepID=A0ABM8PCY6_9HYPH|nr:hypothetical protein [Pseudorhizobium endolithicum]CAD7023352.1 hypothetical protein REJC140_00180 [Pseudorhizobium endolithicum]
MISKLPGHPTFRLAGGGAKVAVAKTAGCSTPAHANDQEYPDDAEVRRNWTILLVLVAPMAVLTWTVLALL